MAGEALAQFEEDGFGEFRRRLQDDNDNDGQDNDDDADEPYKYEASKNDTNNASLLKNTTTIKKINKFPEKNLEDYDVFTTYDDIINHTLYGQTVFNISKYVAIYGMFEEKEGPIYKVYNNVTPDLYTWKKYNTSLKLNEHNLLEMTIPLDDVTL